MNLGKKILVPLVAGAIIGSTTNVTEAQTQIIEPDNSDSIQVCERGNIQVNEQEFISASQSFEQLEAYQNYLFLFLEYTTDEFGITRISTNREFDFALERALSVFRESERMFANEYIRLLIDLMNQRIGGSEVVDLELRLQNLAQIGADPSYLGRLPYIASTLLFPFGSNSVRNILDNLWLSANGSLVNYYDVIFGTNQMLLSNIESVNRHIRSILNITTADNLSLENFINFVEFYRQRRQDILNQIICLWSLYGLSQDQLTNALNSGLNMFPSILDPDPNNRNYAGLYNTELRAIYLKDENDSSLEIFQINPYALAHEYAHDRFFQTQTYIQFINVDYWNQSISLNQAFLVEIIYLLENEENLDQQYTTFLNSMIEVGYGLGHFNPKKTVGYEGIYHEFKRVYGIHLGNNPTREEIYRLIILPYFYNDAILYRNTTAISPLSEIFAEALSVIMVERPDIPAELVDLVNRYGIFAEQYITAEELWLRGIYYDQFRGEQ